jgi:hypothetical protein
MGSQRTRRIQVSGGAVQSAERIVAVALRMAASGNLPREVSNDSTDECPVESNADGLSFVIGDTRRHVGVEDLHALLRRFEQWTVCADKTAGFTDFFQDLNRWETDGQTVIRKTTALLLFARALVSEADKMRWEDFLGRLQRLLPVKRWFAGAGERGRYSVTFSWAEESLLFEMEGHAVRIGTEQIRVVWGRFVEWWCLPSPQREDERAGLDFGGELGSDAGFYAFELACLMNEIEQCKAFA